jgi:hypothetical protein
MNADLDADAIAKRPSSQPAPVLDLDGEQILLNIVTPIPAATAGTWVNLYLQRAADPHTLSEKTSRDAWVKLDARPTLMARASTGLPPGSTVARQDVHRGFAVGPGHLRRMEISLSRDYVVSGDFFDFMPPLALSLEEQTRLTGGSNLQDKSDRPG